MPVLWRYLIIDFIKVTGVCVIAFIAILLTMRFDDIAHFASLGASISYIIFFTLYQIPYILPIALPLSCLIASLILVQKLSHSHEITALRACGFSLKKIITPILMTAGFLAIINFWIASELATQSHLKTNLLKTELRSINPLLLLNHKQLMKMKGFYFTSLGPVHVGESASDVVFALPNRHRERIHLVLARNFHSSPSLFNGENVTLITSEKNLVSNDFDHLLIENIGKLKTEIQDFSDFLQRKAWTINNDYLQFSILLARIQLQKEEYFKAKAEEKDPQLLKQLILHLNRSRSEVIKRLSISLAVFSLTLMGCAFGLNISRKKTPKSLYFVIGLTTFYLISFFIAKSIEHNFFLAGALYLTPHIIIIIVSIYFIKRISKGIELCLK
ncbi:MAG: LptF/LptG family permease [Parachlamydiaceae bacterium]|nr:LptF/LptG family permease [Parachlamydiaceae bacterium]